MMDQEKQVAMLLGDDYLFLIPSLIHFSHWFNDSMAQFFQQRFRLLQVFGIKAFGEPAVDLGQQLPGFVLLALLLPQPTQRLSGNKVFEKQ